jgi:hypothetical protein
MKLAMIQISSILLQGVGTATNHFKNGDKQIDNFDVYVVLFSASVLVVITTLT